MLLLEPGVPFEVWVTTQALGSVVLAVGLAVSHKYQLYRRPAVGLDRQVPESAVIVFDAAAKVSPEIVTALTFTGVMVTR